MFLSWYGNFRDIVHSRYNIHTYTDTCTYVDTTKKQVRFGFILTAHISAKKLPNQALLGVENHLGLAHFSASSIGTRIIRPHFESRTRGSPPLTQKLTSYTLLPRAFSLSSASSVGRRINFVGAEVCGLGIFNTQLRLFVLSGPGGRGAESSVAVICFAKSSMFEDGVMYVMYAIPTTLFEWWVFDGGDDGTYKMGVRSYHIKNDALHPPC